VTENKIDEPDFINCIIPPSDELGGLYLGSYESAIDI